MSGVAVATSDEKRSRSTRDYVLLGIWGFLIGCANVIPGVSGGTMAFILGIYEELIQSIRSAGRTTFLRSLTRFQIRRAAEAINFNFLLAIGIGVAAAALSMAKVLEWLLVARPVPLWSFFFGLILASVFIVARRIRRWRPTIVLALAVGTVGTYFLVAMVPVQTPETWWFLVLSGALAITAMILPGISGAFILLIIGKYQFVLSAVNDLNLVALGQLGIGAVVGLVLFAQVLGWLFQKYHDLTIALLTGLMIGSLRKIWPWKIDVEWIIGRGGERLPTIQQNVLPDFFVAGSFNTEIVAAAVMAIIGLVFVIFLERWGEPNAQHGES